MTAQEIVNMLAARHDASKAFFVKECKLGEQGARRLDAWVLLKTWSPPTTIGYEVKVSRSDFLQDRKWSDYLPVCHEFYFVSPAKLIAPEELPDGVGLLWTAGGSRLVTKRRAVRRQPEVKALQRLMFYVLMSRARPAADMHEASKLDAIEHWRRWLEQKAEYRQLGQAVSRRLREQLEDARKRTVAAEREAERCKDVEARLEALGLPRGSTSRDVDAKARSLVRPDRMLRVEQLARELLTLAREVA